MSESVEIAIDDHVATVTLNRPDKHNAVDLPMFDALAAAGEQLREAGSVRSVIVCGAGENFCAGIDVGVFSDSMSRIDAASLAPVEPSIANRFQRAAYVWRELPMPVICAISGVAFGAGLQIALGADLRYAAPDARLSIMEIKWGLIPDLAISATARDSVAIDRLKELAFTGRIVDAAEALQLGLVTAVHEDPLASARDTALAIAGRSPDAIRAMKTLFDDAWQLPPAESLAREAALQLGLLAGRNQREAVAANLERREPDFDD